MKTYPDNKQRENRLRKLARKYGYVLHKSRQKVPPDSDNHGQYMLLNDRDQLILGARFDASLEDIEKELVLMPFTWPQGAHK